MGHRGTGQARRERRVPEELEDPVGEPLGVMPIHEQSSDSVANHETEPPCGGGNDRRAARLGLEGDQSEGFGPGGHEHGLGRGVEVGQAFVRLRRLLATPGELAVQIAKLADTVQLHDEQIKVIMKVLEEMMNPPAPPPKKGRIGFLMPHEMQELEESSS